MSGDEMSPERVRALLALHESLDPRDVVEHMGAAPKGVRRPAYELLDSLPDLARAYLAEHERAERAERERDEARHGCEVLAVGDPYERLRDTLEAARVYERERDAAVQRAQRAEAEAARLREVVDAARATSRALKRYAVHVSAGLADAWVDLDDALARLDGGSPEQPTDEDRRVMAAAGGIAVRDLPAGAAEASMHVSAERAHRQVRGLS